MNFRTVKNAILEILYPQSLFCINCGEVLKPGSRNGFCSQCTESLPFIQGKLCTKCGKPIMESADCIFENCCQDCADSIRFFDRAVSVFEYAGIIQKLIYRFKYYGECNLSSSFGLFMADMLKNIPLTDIDIILPVPLHPNRKRSRGYNQSELLAAIVSDVLGIKCDTGVLIRQKDTPSQTKLSKNERKENLKDAFKIVNLKAVRDKRILLVDDVLTSGATVDYCSMELKSAGASQVNVATLATVTATIE